jgi:neutral ceramidase
MQNPAKAYAGATQKILSIITLICWSSISAGGDNSQTVESLLRVGAAVRLVNPTKPAVPIGHRGTKAYSAVHCDLRIQAMAVEDSAGTKVIWLGWDNCYVRKETCDRLKKTLSQQYHIPPAAVCINTSHTHSAPALIVEDSVRPDLFDPEYAAFFESQAVETVRAALGAMAPARLRYCEYPCTAVGINRRRNVNGTIELQPNPDGPVDHRVQVIAAESPDDSRLIAACVKYACHPVTVGQSGLGSDYPGFMRKLVEQWHPGATIVFLQGCCANVRIQVLNPQATEFIPGTVEAAERFGRDLALSVEWALKQKAAPISGPIEYDYKIIDLPLAPVPPEQYQKAATGKNPNFQDWGRHFSEILAKGEILPTHNPFHLQVFRLGRSSENPLVLLALGGEVVAEYALQLAARSTRGNLIVLGYSNNVYEYIPTTKMLEEGGYEPTAYRYETFLPGPYKPEIESLIFDAASAMAWPTR